MAESSPTVIAAAQHAVAVALKDNGENILEELETFGIDIATGQPAKISYPIPTEKITKQVNIFGRVWNLTAGEENGKLEITATPTS